MIESVSSLVTLLLCGILTILIYTESCFPAPLYIYSSFRVASIQAVTRVTHILARGGSFLFIHLPLTRFYCVYENFCCCHRWAIICSLYDENGRHLLYAGCNFLQWTQPSFTGAQFMRYFIEMWDRNNNEWCVSFRTHDMRVKVVLIQFHLCQTILCFRVVELLNSIVQHYVSAMKTHLLPFLLM